MKKRGRPSLPVERVRTRVVQVVLSESEYLLIKSRAHSVRLPVSRLLRDLGLSAAIIEIPEINREAFASLARVGSNLNQLARHLNAGISIPFPAPLPDLHELAGLLLVVRRLLLGAATRRAHEGE
jgi:hypothetical protein